MSELTILAKCVQTMPDIEMITAIILAYLLGSLSSAIIVCKLFKLPDPRTQGSRNPGATNVLRLGGKKAAVITLFGDLLKGMLPVLIGKLLGLPDITLALIALAAFLGHLFPIFFHFIGGKGVATALGALIIFSWQAGLAWAGIWLIMAVLFRYSSLAALTAFLLTPVCLWVFTHRLIYTLLFVVIAGILFFRHKKNIAKLLAGTESKIGK